MLQIEKTVQSGLTIGSGEGEVRLGTLGLLVEKDGCVFGLTSQLVLGGNEVYLVQNQNIISTISSSEKNNLKFDPKYSIISGFKINSSISVKPLSLKSNQIPSLAKPIDSLGAQVVTPNEFEHKKVFGLVSAIHVRKNILHPKTEEEIECDELIEISLNDNNDPLSLKSVLAGSLVVSKDDEIVGIVVGVSNEKFYAFPLKDLLKDEEFELLSFETAEQHNSNLKVNDTLNKLIQLCKDFPKDWAEHITKLEEPLYSFFMNYEYQNGYEKLLLKQEWAVERIIQYLTIDDIAEGFPNLKITKGRPGPFANGAWFIKAAFERSKLLEIKSSFVAKLNSNEWRPIEKNSPIFSGSVRLMETLDKLGGQNKDEYLDQILGVYAPESSENIFSEEEIPDLVGSYC